MKFEKKTLDEVPTDMTPMIDMVFQLIIFFMVLINFDAGEQHEQIQLPLSVLARPPEKAPPFPVVLHMTKEGNVIYGGREIPINGMGVFLRREREDMERRKETEATIIIRAHRYALAGKVQDLIKECEDSKNGGFSQFVLRVMEETTKN